MSEQAARAARRRPRRDDTVRKAVSQVSSGPARIPGVHIAHIGGPAGAVEPIRAYWQARGAVFMHHGLEAGGQRRLEEILERSHVVFHAHEGVGIDVGATLQRYCERREKPLILLEENS